MEPTRNAVLGAYDVIQFRKGQRRGGNEFRVLFFAVVRCDPLGARFNSERRSVGRSVGRLVGGMRGGHVVAVERSA